MTAKKASVRLSNAMREAIVRAAMRDLYDPKVAAMAQREHDLLKRAYTVCVPAEAQAALLSLPEGFVTWSLNISFQISGRSFTLSAMRESEDRFFKKPWDYHKANNAALRDDIERFDNDKTKLLEDRRRAMATLTDFLAQFTTTGALLAAWPEGEAYLPKDETKASTALAVQPAQVNALLGLPKDEAQKDAA
jgi:hypothetical protein